MAESNRTGRPRRRASAATAPLAAPLHPALRWVQQNPKTALGIALGIGLVIGLSPRLRRGVVNMMSKAGELMSEAEG
jgi:ElaB/YqjD/DUF883 family membrane-anchored ribosome-binding protein